MQYSNKAKIFIYVFCNLGYFQWKSYGKLEDKILCKLMFFVLKSLRPQNHDTLFNFIFKNTIQKMKMSWTNTFWKHEQILLLLTSPWNERYKLPCASNQNLTSFYLLTRTSGLTFNCSMDLLLTLNPFLLISVLTHTCVSPWIESKEIRSGRQV